MLSSPLLQKAKIEGHVHVPGFPKSPVESFVRVATSSYRLALRDRAYLIDISLGHLNSFPFISFSHLILL